MVRFVTRNNERILIMSISTQLDYFKWSNLTTLNAVFINKGMPQHDKTD